MFCFGFVDFFLSYLPLGYILYVDNTEKPHSYLYHHPPSSAITPRAASRSEASFSAATPFPRAILPRRTRAGTRRWTPSSPPPSRPAPSVAQVRPTGGQDADKEERDADKEGPPSPPCIPFAARTGWANGAAPCRSRQPTTRARRDEPADDSLMTRITGERDGR